MDVPSQHKRLRRINAGATSGNSNKSDNEIQELDVVGNISEEETEEEIPGGGKPEPAENFYHAWYFVSCVMDGKSSSDTLNVANCLASWYI